MKKNLIVICLMLLPLTATAQADNAFDRLFAQAENFARLFPREKVHLHFDNTSYYQGDTIWFKAYLVTADDNKPSNISRPLYVDLLDQLGNIVDQQIIKIENGVGTGQISLVGRYFTGYYEVRAYTKWMLATNEAQYFSRTFPVYRKRITADEPRSIAHYHMDKSMKQRPVEKVKIITARFFPEGGRLIKGLPSVVGFETLREDEGWVNVNGYLLSENGERTLPISTIHDGMGTFVYTPGDKPAQVEIEYKGSTHKFTLPAAESEGIVMGATMRNDEIDVKVTRSGAAEKTDIALFIFSQGIPLTYVPVDFDNSSTKQIRIPHESLPEGVIRLAIIDANGKTLADRFCYMRHADNGMKISTTTNAETYRPFQKVECQLRLTDSQGNPVSNAEVSVAVRDGAETDYAKYDNTIETDLLLTSELRGYINQPGYYFTDNSLRLRKLLDNLMIIRGWRKYDLDTEFGLKTFTPKYLPETQLTLYGHVKSMFRGTQRDLGVSVLANGENVKISSTTETDSLGDFSIPLENFEGDMEALIQTRKEGKKYNRMSDVMLFRSFQPEPRILDTHETNPVWDEPVDSTAFANTINNDDDYVPDDDVHMIDEVTVNAKRKKQFAQKRTEAFERDIIAYYDIRQIIDKLRDDGVATANDFGYILHLTNNKIDRAGDNYGTVPMRYSIDGRTMERFFFNTYIDAIEKALLYTERSGLTSYRFDSDTYRATNERSMTYWDNTYNEGLNPENDSVNYANLDKPYVRCDVTMRRGFNPNKNYKPTKGIRYTVIQGYTRPAEFYSPLYPDEIPVEAYDDARRTLYWNPAMCTDDNGVIKIDCYNNRETNFLNINAETIVDGHPAATTHISFNGRQTN